ncbi:MAG: hypothetical protein Q4F00_05800 [bacterium]|nr:hypothetical protein [bacterium]
MRRSVIPYNKLSRAAAFLLAALFCLTLPLRAFASNTPEVTIESITAAPDYSKYKSPVAQICAQVDPATDATGSVSAEVFINGAKVNQQDLAWLDSLNTYDADSSIATVNLRVPVDQGLHDYLRGTAASLAKEYTVSIPDSVTSIDNEAFYLCDNLKLIYYNGSASGSPWGAGAEL